MRENRVRPATKALGRPEATWTLGSDNRLRLGVCHLHSRLKGWLLLGETMQRPQPPHQIHRVNSHDRPILDQLREDAERDAVLGVVERRHQDGSVRDVEVRITRGEALALEVERRRHRQMDYVDIGTVFESHYLKTLTVFLEWPVVRVVRGRMLAL